MIALPETITPEELAKHMGWSGRRIRSLARELGLCVIIGKKMLLTQSDAAILFLSTRANITVDDVREWLGEDAAEQHQEAEAQRFMEPTGIVYFLAYEGRVKIGFTKNLAKRLTNLQTAIIGKMETLLTIPGTPALEAYFHQKFDADRIEREWFNRSEELTNFIARREHATR